MSTEKVVVTGLGPVSAVGIGVDAFWNSLLSGKSAAAPLRRFAIPAGVGASFSCEIDDFDPTEWIDPTKLKRTDRFIQFAIASARLALQDAGISHEDLAGSRRAGCCLGTAAGGFSGAEGEHERFLEGGVGAISPSFAARVFGASAHTQVQQDLGIHGHGSTNWNSCAAGNCAVGEAFDLVRHGVLDLAIAGGAEAPLSPLVFASFDKLRTMSRLDVAATEAMRPFDEARDGFVMAEGAASLILESERHAKARGARIYAEVTGFGVAHEAHHPTTPDPSATHLMQAIRSAVMSGGPKCSEIGLVSAHGSATRWNDPNELRAIQGDSGAKFAKKTVISAIKPNLGHTLGAGGAFEALSCALMLHHAVVPPILNLSDPVPHSGMILPTSPEPIDSVSSALNLSLGFGGIDSATLFQKTGV